MAQARAAGKREDSKYFYCLYCTEGPIFSTNISTNMQKHLRIHHEIDLTVVRSRIELEATSQLQQLYLHAKTSGNTDNINTLVFQEYLNQDIIDQALVSILRSLSLIVFFIP